MTKIYDEEQLRKHRLRLFFMLVALVALGNGFSDAIYGNFFKDAYNVTAQQRAFIEFPRELPGILCVIIVSLLSFWGDVRIAVLAQVLAFTGLTILGVTSPSFAAMCFFLFINSLGMHIFMPLQDSIGMSLAKEGQVGRRVGQYKSLQVFCSMIAAIFVFIGFRTDVFTFKTTIKPVFLIGSFFFIFAIIVSSMLAFSISKTQQKTDKQKFRILFRKEYTLYYVLTTLHGVQKQIAFVFGAWVIIDLLRKGADSMSLLLIAASFVGIFFMQKLGSWIDKLGIKKMMYLDALSFIFIYLLYGFVVWGITDKFFPETGWTVLVVYALFILDRLSMNIGVVKSVYIKHIALKPSDVGPTLSTGISLDHIVSIIAAQISGFIWMTFGPQWVFFIAAFLSLGNLIVAYKVKDTSH